MSRPTIVIVGAGDVVLAHSVLRHAPHTAASIAGEWDHPYDRAPAVFPAGVHAREKHWPPVGRVDGAYGDRNPVCGCPPPEAFEDCARATRRVVDPARQPVRRCLAKVRRPTACASGDTHEPEDVPHCTDLPTVTRHAAPEVQFAGGRAVWTPWAHARRSRRQDLV